MKESHSKTRFIRRLGEVLGLPRTSKKILNSLARAGKYLRVKELVKRVKMSERSVRKHLRILFRRGFLRRRTISDGSKRLTYEYSLTSIHEMLSATKHYFSRSLQRLEVIVSRVSGKKARDTNPKSA